jgi:hypothetical protein
MPDFTEILLWNLVVIITFSVNSFWWHQYRTRSRESKPFFLGLLIFGVTYGVARLIENIRSLNIGSYNDVYEAWIIGQQITGLNLVLRLMYYVISWSGIAMMFFSLENKLFRKSRYIVTIAAIMEGVVSVLNYFFFNDLIFYLSSVFFFVVMVMPLMFINLARKTPSGSFRKSSITIAIGITLFAFGVLNDLPEFAYFQYLTGIQAEGSEIFSRYAAPISINLGIILLMFGFSSLFKAYEGADKIDEALKTFMEKIGIDLTRPDDLTEEDIAFYREQTTCLVCKTLLVGYKYNFICPTCRALYCDNCAGALSALENACWSCKSPIDEDKPVSIEILKKSMNIDDKVHKKTKN